MYGQINVPSNLKSKKIIANKSIEFEQNVIVPNSLSIKKIDTSFYTIDYTKALIYWKKKVSVDSVELVYRVFAIDFTKTYSRFNYDSVKNNFIATQPSIFSRPLVGDEDFLNFGNINYSGSFGRNLSFGNNQNAVFNSQLNLQLNGFIGDSIEIVAAITDNNIPIQPDGTTQTLNEFDRILLQFKKKNWELNIGDIDVRQNQNYFLNFYKRLQGIYYVNEKKVGNISKNKFQFAGAIAKGKFTRNVFNGLEGNQGPYRLQGANSEIYFIVLAGTERVFIDGELLQRGEDQDYVINYNTAELTFTPKRMITKDKRIQIEFEYAERSYLNSMLYLSNETQLNSKLKVKIAAYSNVDAKNSPVNQQLDNKQKQFLANLGNNYQNAFYINENLDSFSTSKILYAKRVNLLNSNDSIYVYSTNKDSAKYNLVFTEIGSNKGNYIPYFNGANGKVYQWVAPLNSIPQGNYEPAQFLVTPKKQQIITIGTEYWLNKKTFFKSDVALSNYDVNAFSTINKSNNKGTAGNFSLENDNQLSSNSHLKSALSYEWADQFFKPLERLRTVEFYRDWGLNIINSNATEHLPKLAFTLKDKKDNQINYTVEGYFRSDDYSGVKNTLLQDFKLYNWNFKNSFSYVVNKSFDSKGYFYKPNIDVSKTLKKFNNYIIGFNYTLEHNEQHRVSNDSILPISFSFKTITAYLKSNPQKLNKWGFNFFTRSDKIPFYKTLQQVDKSYNYNINLELLKNIKHQVKLNTTYRELIITNSNLSNLQPDKSLLGRVEYNINEMQGFILGYVLYELGAGQEQRRDYSYVEVPAGRGQYTWNDYNNDGIPQLNEFEIAVFTDQAKYIRIFTPTNQFLKANYTQFNYSLNLYPRNIANKIRNVKFGKFISRFYVQSSLQTSKKVLSDGSFQLNPFEKNINDTALINFTNTYSNTLSFNRSSSVWGIDISNIKNYNKAILTYGLESRQLNDWNIRARVNFKKSYSFELIQKWTNNELNTPQFSNRNYNIQSTITEPKIIYTYLTKFRAQASLQFVSKKNQQSGAEKVSSKAFNIETKYNSIQNTSLIARFTFNNIQYQGTSNTTVSYIMLDGLLPGKNYLWSVEFTKRLNNNFEISFNYEGRKPGESRVINIGRASVRAIL